MPKIIPTIMARDIAELEAKYLRVAPYVDEVQIDVMDGVFVSSESWRTPEELVAAEWLALPFELHLMIEKPERTIAKWLATGADRIIVHIESTEQLPAIFATAKAIGTEIALGLNLDTPLAKIQKWLSEVRIVQIMGIAKVGYQNQPFDERVLERITELKKIAPHVTIAIDGGVSSDTIPALVKVGAERLAVGSALFGSDDVSAVIQELRQIISNSLQ